MALATSTSLAAVTGGTLSGPISVGAVAMPPATSRSMPAGRVEMGVIRATGRPALVIVNDLPRNTSLSTALVC